ncbi:hypothetical protein BCR43DRAFT_482582 [Syncephalastrum racemosum]|uniref:Uncharacterized protein n=1 Tax=Syncephalastrum racemosum TaxID=13706 RepID=A0A1X2HTU1_SYNRA|nr:hypothetical protein BCR43DRAFT_482582 [Syncephalastrum racemosum]
MGNIEIRANKNKYSRRVSFIKANVVLNPKHVFSFLVFLRVEWQAVAINATRGLDNNTTARFFRQWRLIEVFRKWEERLRGIPASHEHSDMFVKSGMVEKDLSQSEALDSIVSDATSDQGIAFLDHSTRFHKFGGIARAREYQGRIDGDLILGCIKKP